MTPEQQKADFRAFVAGLEIPEGTKAALLAIELPLFDTQPDLSAPDLATALALRLCWMSTALNDGEEFAQGRADWLQSKIPDLVGNLGELGMTYAEAVFFLSSAILSLLGRALDESAGEGAEG